MTRRLVGASFQLELLMIPHSPSFTNQVGAHYAVQSTASLAPTNWLTLTNLVGNGSTLDVTNRNPSSATRFYRVESQ